MAVTLVLEDGTGDDETANSYASVAEADTYLDMKAPANDWYESSDGIKAEYLVWASKLLDQRATWNGSKTVTTSPLRWPRTGVCDVDDLPIDTLTIPDQLKAAVIELAWHLLKNSTVDPMAVPITESDNQIKRIKADVVEIEYQELKDRNLWDLAWPRNLNDILRGLGRVPGNSGSNFAPISRV